MSMMFPMIMYWITHKDNWLKKCMLPMAVTEENITHDIYETAKLSINYTNVKAGMPSNVAGKDMKNCKAPTLVMAVEKDCLFPTKRVLPRAEQIIENVTTFLLMGILAVLCILGIITFFGNLHYNYWWRWIYLCGGGYVLFDLFAIATGIEFWHDLLLVMFDVNATYWNLLWGGFIVLGGAVFVLGCLLLKRRLNEAKYSGG